VIKEDEFGVIIDCYECEMCHNPEALRGSAYKVEIGGKKKAVCGKCYRELRENGGLNETDKR
jgi:ribosome-binding protein aMBF1 (putative translation factor)